MNGMFSSLVCELELSYLIKLSLMWGGVGLTQASPWFLAGSVDLHCSSLSVHRHLGAVFILPGFACVIPFSVADTSRSYSQGGMWYGVDINNEDIADNFEAFVWEPAVVRINALTAASEAACLIVSVDETIKNPRSTVDASSAMRGRGQGRPHNH